MTFVRACFHAIALALLVAPPATVAAGPATIFEAAAVDRAFDDTVQRYRLPGLAVGIVVDGEVVYARTTGELETGGGQAIDQDTLFKIASNTKAMTTGLLARLVDA